MTTTNFSAGTVIESSWLNALDELRYDSDGVKYTKYLPPWTGAVSRAADDKLDERVSVKDFGAVGDGSTNDATAIQAAFTAAAANGFCIYFPAGTYVCNSTINASGKCSIVGEGSGQSVLRFGTNVGLSYTGGVAAEYTPAGLNIYRMGFKTTNQNTGSVILASWTSGAGSTANGVVMEDVEISGTSGSNGFANAIRLVNARNSSFRNIRILGDRDSATVNSSVGFRIEGSSSPVEFAFEHCRVYFVQTALSIADAAEGIYINNCAFVAVKRGVGWIANPGGRPLLVITGSHINCTESAINLEEVVQSIVSNNLFYITNYSGLASATAVGIQFLLATAANLAVNITNNILYYINGAATKTGIALLTGAGTETSIIASNIIAAFDTGIVLQATTSDSIISNTNKYISCTTDVSNSGTSLIQPVVPWSTSVVITVGTGVANSSHNIAIPTGYFSAKPSVVCFTQAGPTASYVPMHFLYDYDSASSTATNIVVTISNIDGTNLGGGNVRVSVLAAP